MQARYTLTTITTKDLKVVERREIVKKLGYTDEAIYTAGIESIEKHIDLDKQ